MDELISKKELLDKYGISYGALYRWKRMGLIPEDWFEKKSAVTGQETYFPRAAITERIETILRLKDQMSLEEIAEQLGCKDKENDSALKIVWDGGTTQIPLRQIRSVTVNVIRKDKGSVIVDLTSAFESSTDIDIEKIEDRLNSSVEKATRKMHDAVEKMNSKMYDADSSIEQAVLDLDKRIAEATQVIQEIMNRKGNK